jgi:hypothetical protein
VKLRCLTEEKRDDLKKILWVKKFKISAFLKMFHLKDGCMFYKLSIHVFLWNVKDYWVECATKHLQISSISKWKGLQFFKLDEPSQFYESIF